MTTAPATKLIPAEEKLFGGLFKVVLGVFAALAALHLWVMVSVLPYVWVSDISANCGARLVLSRAASQMYLIFACLAGAFVAFALLKGFSRLVETFPVLQKFAQRFDASTSRRNAYGLACTALLGVALLAMLATLVSDVEFFNHPPNLPANVRACAHPTNTASW